MQWNTFKRPRIWIPGSILLILLIAIAVLFHPAFQKSMLLRYATPYLDYLRVERIHVTPWTVRLSKLQTGFEGGRYTLEEVRLRFCISSLLFKKIRIQELHIDGAHIDIREMQSRPEQDKPASPFKGVMASLEHGFAYQLEQLSAKAEALLPNEQSITLNLESDGVAPESIGDILAHMRYNTGQGDDHIVVDTQLKLDQLTHGKFNSIENLTNLTVSVASLPGSERIKINTLINRLDSEIISDETGKDVIPPANDDYRLEIEILDANDNVRSTLNTAGIYDGSLAETRGNYRFSANEKLLQPYLSGEPLPPLTQNLNGDFSYTLTNQTGDISVASNLQVNDLQKKLDSKNIPQVLNLKSDFRIQLLADRQLQVSQLTASLADDNDHLSLTANSPKPLNAPLDNLPAILKQKNTLLEFELPELPLQWFDFLLPDYEIKQGNLTAAFRISTDEDSTIYLRALKPIQITGLTLLQDQKPVIEDFTLSVSPDVTYQNAVVNLTFDGLQLMQGDNELLTAVANSKIQLAEAKTSVQLDSKINLNTYPTLNALNSSISHPQGLPSIFSLSIASSLNQTAEGLQFNKAELDIDIQNRQSLINASLQQPIQLKTVEDRQILETPAGQIANIDLSAINLGWISAFIPSLEMTGILESANFSYTGNTSSSTLVAQKPVRLKNVHLTSAGQNLLSDINIDLSPTVEISGQNLSVRYNDLLIRSSKRTLLRGDGQFSNNAEQTSSLAEGQLQVDLQALTAQPVLKEMLQGSITSTLKFDSSYSVRLFTDKLIIDKLNGALKYEDDSPRISLRTDSGISIPLKKRSASIYESGARGKIELKIDRLTPEPFAEILERNNIRFQEITGKLALSSSGKKFDAIVTEPLQVINLSIGPDDKPQVGAVTVSTLGNVTGDGITLTANLNELAITEFSTKERSVQADIELQLRRPDHDAAFSLNKAKAECHASLPSLLKQPALLPSHNLKTGLLDLDFELAANKEVRSILKLHKLQAKRELALKDLTLELNGKWNTNGSFFLTGPVRTQGKSGQSDLNVSLEASAWSEKNPDLKVGLESSLFYLNDILGMVEGIQKASKPKEKNSSSKKKKKKTQIVRLNLKPDEKAFWDSLPYQTEIDFDIEKLYYTDYLIIDSIHGNSSITKDELSISEFTAFFHDSPLRIESVMSFSAQTSTPYDLKLEASIKQFDLATFLKELVPKSKPRAEGLFDISLAANGRSPNLQQYRNELFFDMRLQSRDGLFRILDPNSALVSGSTNTLGAIGEGVSYVPTGLFGVGAVSRLVKYIKVIDYDKIDIRLTRDDSRDISIDRYIVQNPELLMTATGGITYNEGSDVLQSPMDMQAQLSFKGHGAAIMYDLDLLTKEKNEYGYWIGPTVQVTGTAAESSSNLSEIITQAGNGAVLGGITRPISGLIGNIRFRWFDKDKNETSANEEQKNKE